MPYKDFEKKRAYHKRKAELRDKARQREYVNRSKAKHRAEMAAARGWVYLTYEQQGASLGIEWAELKRGYRALAEQRRRNNRTDEQRTTQIARQVRSLQKVSQALRAVVDAEKFRRGECCRCGLKVVETHDHISGVSAPVYAFDFDHRDPSEKLFAISRLATVPSSRYGGSFSVGSRLPMLLAEMEKCDLLCAICHRVKTAEDWR